ncbi:hypothetical protein HNO88_003135 [Novosphingobium chloroacetimidivorans]|uniref:Uncharacterized protein n=1 Tax=Novosphingobium chloroacetimidivorans TaxID=1428314 RepID=A0A7W7KCY7_9SPHN|nr:hypothetical protein [Novosphingobium chloroacetimidivorans]MBB4859803.1 hypothetical protein [Novosphingobium chloroacetimidivorans]
MKGRAGKRKVKRVVFLVVAVPVLALLGYAWTDGGRQPLRDIVEPVPVPGPHSGNAK